MVYRNKRTGHVYAPNTKAAEERRRKEREFEVQEEWERDNRLRGEGTDFYFSGRRKPLLDQND